MEETIPAAGPDTPGPAVHDAADAPVTEAPVHDAGHAEKPPHEHKPPGSGDRPARYHVLHDAVGGHAKGAKVTAKQLGEDCDLDRLLSLGAIAPVVEVEDDTAAE